MTFWRALWHCITHAHDVGTIVSCDSKHFYYCATCHEGLPDAKVAYLRHIGGC